MNGACHGRSLGHCPDTSIEDIIVSSRHLCREDGRRVLISRNQHGHGISLVKDDIVGCKFSRKWLIACSDGICVDNHVVRKTRRLGKVDQQGSIEAANSIDIVIATIISGCWRL